MSRGKQSRDRLVLGDRIVGLSQQFDEALGGRAGLGGAALQDAEGPHETRVPQGDRGDRPRADFALERRQRQQRHPRRDLDRLLDILHVVELQDHVDGDAVVAEEAVHLPADDEVLVEAHVLQAVEPGHRDAALGDERVGRRTGHHHLLLAPRDRGELPAGLGEGDEAEVGGPVQHPLRHPVGVEVLDLDLHAGLLGHEALDVLAHVAQAHRVDGGHADGDFEMPAVAVADARLDLEVLVDQLLATVVVGFAAVGQLKGTARTIHELDPEALLQLVDDLAHGRLGNLVGVRRPGEALVPRDIAEHLQRLELHIPDPTIRITNVNKLIDEVC